MNKISLQILLGWFVKDFFKIILIGGVVGVCSVIYALSLPNQYSAKTVVASNLSDAKSMGGALSSLGGLASMAGISIGGGSAMSPEVLYETVTSRSFLASFIRKQKLEPIIMAAVDFNPTSDEFVYDEKIYNKKDETWVRDYIYPQTLEPNDFELVEKFNKSFSATYARKTKLITLKYQSFSPKFSKQVVEELVKFFNTYIRNRDLEESNSSIKYLETELADSKYKEVKLALQQVMEEQFKKLALAKTREEYAFQVIEAPLLAAKKSEPKRAIICVIGTFGGTLLTVLIWWSVRAYRISQ